MVSFSPVNIPAVNNFELYIYYVLVLCEIGPRNNNVTIHGYVIVLWSHCENLFTIYQAPCLSSAKYGRRPIPW